MVAEERRLRELAKAEKATGDSIYWPVFNLDRKNPNQRDEDTGDVTELLPAYEKLLGQIAETRAALKAELFRALANKAEG